MQESWESSVPLPVAMVVVVVVVGAVRLLAVAVVVPVVVLVAVRYRPWFFFHTLLKKYSFDVHSAPYKRIALVSFSVNKYSRNRDLNALFTL